VTHEERRRQLAEERYGGICECGDHAWCRLTQGYVAFVDVTDADTIKEQAYSIQQAHGALYAAHAKQIDNAKIMSHGNEAMAKVTASIR